MVMKVKTTITMSSRTRQMIIMNKGHLSISDYIEQSLLNYFEFEKNKLIKEKKGENKWIMNNGQTDK